MSSPMGEAPKDSAAKAHQVPDSQDSCSFRRCSPPWSPDPAARRTEGRGWAQVPDPARCRTEGLPIPGCPARATLPAQSWESDGPQARPHPCEAVSRRDRRPITQPDRIHHATRIPQKIIPMWRPDLVRVFRASPATRRACIRRFSNAISGGMTDSTGSAQRSHALDWSVRPYFRFVRRGGPTQAKAEPRSMSQELHYTSVPRGLKPGSRGFGTVAATAESAGLAGRSAGEPQRLPGRLSAR